MTSQDVGLALRCSYQLQNYSLTSGLDLAVASRVPTVAEESTVVPPPTVFMKIVAREGGDTNAAQVGLLEMRDRNEPFFSFIFLTIHHFTNEC